MSRKRKRKNRTNDSTRFERARRELAKGNAKVAFKDAILCYRESASPANRQLLEEAYVARVEQLHRRKQLDEARTVFARLVDFAPTTPEVLKAIPRLRIVLGDSDVDADAVFAEAPELLIEQVDRSILDTREVVPDHGDIRLQVESVRDALARVERGDDEGAAESLRKVPRGSPLGDWKLFVRGLSAFYTSDKDRMHENWRRLDPNRPAYVISRTLLVAAGDRPQDDSPIDLTASLGRLERKLQENPASDLVKEMAERWHEEELSSFFKAFRRLQERHAKTDGVVIEKAIDFVWKRAVRDGDVRLLDSLVLLDRAPADDPHWLRARAIMAERPGQPSCEPVAANWIAYADELISLPTLPEAERPIASSLVYSHLAERFVQYGEACSLPSHFEDQDERDIEESDAFFTDAVRYFEEAIWRYPKLNEAYQGLALLHEQMESPEKSATVFENLIRQDPDDYSARIWLANYYLDQNDPTKSEPHTKVATRLKPRNALTHTVCWKQRVTMARCLAKNRQFQAARQELDATVSLQLPDTVEPFTLDVLRAAIEFKAGSMEAAQTYLDAAIDKVDEPTAVWLMMSFTAARYSLPHKIKKDFDERFKKAIKSRPKSQAAGSLANFFVTLDASGINYPGRVSHKRLVTSYLQRAKRVKWTERDIVRVCDYMAALPEEATWGHRIVATGIKRFPRSPFIHFASGRIEMSQGPMNCDIGKATQHMNRVVELMPNPTTQTEIQITRAARAALSVLDATKEMMNERSFSPPFFSNGDEEEGECDCEACRRHRERFSSPEDLDAQTFLDEIKRTMPPSFLEQMERAAAESGRSLLEMMNEVVEEYSSGTTPPNNGERTPNRRHKKSQQAASR